MDLVNFKVGCKYIALNILDILLTERYEDNLTNLPCDNACFVGVKEFMNVPTPVFDMGLWMNRTTTQDTNTNLLKELRAHFDAFSQLEVRMTEEQMDGESLKALQALQTWCDQFESDNEDLTQLIEKTASLVAQGLQMLNHESSSQLKHLVVSPLIRILEAACEHVEISYKPIIVFTTLDGQTPYLGLLVDKVEDSVNINDEEIKPLESVTQFNLELSEQTRKMLKGIANIGDKYTLLVNPAEIFRPEVA